jgi:hypothetical protein
MPLPIVLPPKGVRSILASRDRARELWSVGVGMYGRFVSLEV